MLCLFVVIPAEAEEGELSFSFLFPISDGVVVAVVVVMKTCDGSGNNKFHRIPWEHDSILTCCNYTRLALEGSGTFRRIHIDVMFGLHPVEESIWCGEYHTLK